MACYDRNALADPVLEPVPTGGRGTDPNGPATLADPVLEPVPTGGRGTDPNGPATSADPVLEPVPTGGRGTDPNGPARLADPVLDPVPTGGRGTDPNGPATLADPVLEPVPTGGRGTDPKGPATLVDPESELAPEFRVLASPTNDRGAPPICPAGTPARASEPLPVPTGGRGTLPNGPANRGREVKVKAAMKAMTRKGLVTGALLSAEMRSVERSPSFGTR
jgi:hypothetical protein